MKVEKVAIKNSTVSFNRRLSVAEKLRIIKYTEKSIHAAFNYYRVPRPTIKYWIKEKEELIQEIKKMCSATFPKFKLAKTVPHEEELLDFILYNWDLDSASINN